MAPCHCQEGAEPGSGYMAWRWDQDKDMFLSLRAHPSLPCTRSDAAQVFPTLYSLPQLLSCHGDVAPDDMHTLAGSHQTWVTAGRGRGWVPHPHPRAKTAARSWGVLGKQESQAQAAAWTGGRESSKSKKEIQAGVASEESPKDSTKRAK